MPTNRMPLSQLGDRAGRPQLGLLLALVPGAAGPAACRRGRSVFVGRVHRRRGDLRVRRRAERLDGPRRLELQRPERQVVPVAAQVAHGAVAEVPPAVPFRPGEVDLVERPGRRGAEPEVPVEPGGDRRGVRRAARSRRRCPCSAGPPPSTAGPRPGRPRRGPRCTGPMAPVWISSTTRR